MLEAARSLVRARSMARASQDCQPLTAPDNPQASQRMNKLLGKRALVTAGAQGIGLAISRQLLEAGCDVFIHYRSSTDAAKALVSEADGLRRRCAATSGDLNTTEEADRVVAEAVTFLGGLDVLINNAGSLIARRAFPDADDDFWAQTMSLNLGSLRKITRA